jgi:hypothetical protein
MCLEMAVLTGDVVEFRYEKLVRRDTRIGITVAVAESVTATVESQSELEILDSASTDS